MRLSFCCVAMLTAICYYSCVDDQKVSEQHQLAPPVSEAQQWFNSHYGEKVKTRTSFSGIEEFRDIAADWENADIYTKGERQTVEVPIISNVIPYIADEETGMRVLNGEKIDGINHVRLVIETNQTTGETRGFIMTVIGSYDYITSDKLLSESSYLYREPDLDGAVFFTEINGKFANGWLYKNGVITASLLPRHAAPTSRNTRAIEVAVTCYLTWTEYYYYWLNPTTGERGPDTPNGIGNIHTECFDNDLGGMQVSYEGNDHHTGGGGAYNNGPYNPSSLDDNEDPCTKAASLSTDSRLRFMINDFMSNINPNGGSENGWIRTVGDNVLSPIERTRTSLKYNLSQLNGDKIVEQYHTHPGGSHRPSWGDLEALAFEYRKGYIDVEQFSYGVITDMGCTVLVITSEQDFAAFANKIVNNVGNLHVKYDRAFIAGGGVPERLCQLITFFIQNQAGVDVLFNESVKTGYPYTLGNQWETKGLDSTAVNIINKEC